MLHLIFGAPVAHEDNEERAVGCGLEMQDAVGLKELSFIVDQRIGIASGHVFAGNVGSEQRREYTVMGDVVNLSASLFADRWRRGKRQRYGVARRYGPAVGHRPSSDESANWRR
jgi:hypothetical protein